MFDYFKAYFTFTRSQQNGIVVLIVLIVLLVIAPYLVPLFVKQPEVDFTGFHNEISAFEQQTVKETTAPPSALIELNTADSAQLDALKGIGAVLSRRIVKFRTVLGGFTSVDQLKEVYGLDSAWVKKMHASFYVDTALIVKIPINIVSEEELKKHPYFRKNIAGEIIAYRAQHGAFGSIEDLRKVEAVNESVFRKIRPYVTLK